MDFRAPKWFYGLGKKKAKGDNKVDLPRHLGKAKGPYAVLVGALTMLFVALLVNNCSANPKRHYPVYWL